MSDVREAVSLHGNTPSIPPPLCSLCRHKAPLFGKPPRQFTYQELEEATHGFSDENLLADGWSGRVHRGMLQDGRAVAVKQLKTTGRNNLRGVEEFLTEVEMLSRAQHRNVVMLVGFCIEENVRVLVYEYICNGSLDFHLYGMGMHLYIFCAYIYILFHLFLHLNLCTLHSCLIRTRKGTTGLACKS